MCAAIFSLSQDLDLSYCDKLENVSDLKGLKLRCLSLRGTAVDDAGFEDFLKSKNAHLLEDLDLSASKADQAALITDRTAKMLSVSTGTKPQI